MQYCAYTSRNRMPCSKTSDPKLNSDKCEINQKTRRCVVKKTKYTKKVLKTHNSSKKLNTLTDLKCVNEEDPITFSNFKEDKVPVQNIVALPHKDNQTLCFEDETLWNMFANHVNHDYNVFVNASKGNFNGILPINMSVWGIPKSLLSINVACDFLKKRAKQGIMNKEFRNPNAPYVSKHTQPQALLENFLVDRIDPNNSIHVEHLTKSILGTHKH